MPANIFLSSLCKIRYRKFYDDTIYYRKYVSPQMVTFDHYRASAQPKLHQQFRLQNERW